MSHVFYVLAVSEPNVDDMTKQRSVFAATRMLSVLSHKKNALSGCVSCVSCVLCFGGF